MRDSSVSEYRQMSGITISLSNDLDFMKTDALIENGVFRDATHAYATITENIINSYQNLEDKYGISWHRSTETVLSENPYSGWVSKKRWPLNEELNIHMMLFQQVKYIYY